MMKIPPLPVNTRRMSPEDIEPVLGLWRFGNPGNKGSKVEYHQWLNDGASEPVVAVHGNNILGSAILDRRRYIIPERAWLCNVIVRPDARGRKICEQMLCHILDACVGTGAISCALRVEVGNTPARRAYEKFGFEDAASLSCANRERHDGSWLLMEAPDLQSASFQNRLKGIRLEQQTWFSSASNRSGAVS